MSVLAYSGFPEKETRGGGPGECISLMGWRGGGVEERNRVTLVMHFEDIAPY